MPSFSQVEIAFTNVSSVAQAAVGSQHEFLHPTYGWVMARYVKNAEASTAFAQGDLIQWKASTIGHSDTILCATAKTPTRKIAGVADHAIAAGSYGWVICRGQCKIECDGSVAANDSLMSEGTAGRVKTATLTNADEVASVVGFAQEADAAAGSLVYAYISV